MPRASNIGVLFRRDPTKAVEPRLNIVYNRNPQQTAVNAYRIYSAKASELTTAVNNGISPTGPDPALLDIEKRYYSGKLRKEEVAKLSLFQELQERYGNKVYGAYGAIVWADYISNFRELTNDEKLERAVSIRRITDHVKLEERRNMSENERIEITQAQKLEKEFIKSTNKEGYIRVESGLYPNFTIKTEERVYGPIKTWRVSKTIKPTTKPYNPNFWLQ